MKSTFKNLQSHILQQSLKSGLRWFLPIAVASSAGFLEAVTNLAETYFGPTILARLTLTLLSTSLGLSAYLWTHRSKYEFDKFLGLWKEIKTDSYICSSCKSKNIISPMRETHEEFICPVKECERVAYKKGHGSPMPETISSKEERSFKSSLDRYVG